MKKISKSTLNLNALFLIFIMASFSAYAADEVYTEFSMEQFDNSKPNGFIEFWKLECHGKTCALNAVAFRCPKDKKIKLTKPNLDAYSTNPGFGQNKISNIKVEGNPKKIGFDISQAFGPNIIKCTVNMSKSVTEVQSAICSGEGVWSAGTKYVREWKMISNGPFMLEDKCEQKVEFP